MNKYIKSIRTKYIFLCILSFTLPIFFLSIILILKGITPFGSKTLLSGDLMAQYINFYTELCNKLKSGDNLLFSWTRGLGIDYISECSYYNMTPANLIYIFFNNKTMPCAITISLLIKCGFAGLFMFIYLHIHNSYLKNTKHEFSNFFIFLSSFYALSSYFINYSTNIIWIDSFMIFPMIMLSLELLVKNKKHYLYTLTLFFAIVTNFYIGYMICIFCVLYFIYLLICTDYTSKILFTIKNFIIYSLIAGVLCSFIIIPTLFALSSSDAGSLGFYKTIEDSPLYLFFLY